ncbi:unnamed protein product, partial [Musa textilis]
DDDDVFDALLLLHCHTCKILPIFQGREVAQQHEENSSTKHCTVTPNNIWSRKNSPIYREREYNKSY